MDKSTHICPFFRPRVPGGLVLRILGSMRRWFTSAKSHLADREESYCVERLKSTRSRLAQFGKRTSSEGVGKLPEGSLSTIFGGHSTPPEHPIIACGPLMRPVFLEWPSDFSRFEFFYSFNVQGDRRCAALSRSVPWNDGIGVGATADIQLPEVARRFVAGRLDCLVVRGSARRPVTYL